MSREAWPVGLGRVAAWFWELIFHLRLKLHVRKSQGSRENSLLLTKGKIVLLTPVTHHPFWSRVYRFCWLCHLLSPCAEPIATQAKRAASCQVCEVEPAQTNLARNTPLKGNFITSLSCSSLSTVPKKECSHPMVGKYPFASFSCYFHMWARGWFFWKVKQPGKSEVVFLNLCLCEEGSNRQWEGCKTVFCNRLSPF